jgi:quinolinate synthase
MLDLLRQGTPPEINHVLAGDVIDEATGRRDRLDEDDRATLIAEAKIALDRMIQITEASP